MENIKNPDRYNETDGFPSEGSDNLRSSSLPSKGHVWLVTRHYATQQWLERDLGISARVISHLDNTHLNQLDNGDTVIGNIPALLAAQVCERGAHYCVISLDYSQYPELRGVDLNPEQLQQLNPCIERYHITRIGCGI